MLLEEMSRREWEKYERMKQLYKCHLVWFRIRLGLLLASSVIAASLVFLLIGWLLVVGLTDPMKNIKLLAFLVINLSISVYTYFQYLQNRPWNSMLYLPEKDFPELYRKVNWTAHLMRAPRIHKIYLNTEFNAAVSAENIFLPGLRRNVLMLGWPLLCAMSSKGILGTLAHELGHISGRHPFGGALFVRIELFWCSLHLGVFSFLTNLYARWFLRHLYRYELPVRYAEEQSADSFISRTFGEDYLLECLTRLHVYGTIYAKGGYWLKALAAAGENGSVSRVELLRQDFQRNQSDSELKRMLNDALTELPPVTEEHPPFAERVGNRSADELLVYLKSEPDAAEKLLGDVSALEERFRPYEDELLDGLRQALAEQQDAVALFNPETADWRDWYSQIDHMNTLDNMTEVERLLDEALKRFPQSLSIQSLELIHRLSSTSGEHGKEIAGKLEQLAAAHPLLIYEINDPLLTFYLKNGCGDEVKHWFDHRDAAMKGNTRQLEEKLSPDDNIRGMVLPESFVRNLQHNLIPLSKHIESIYLFERFYDPGIAVCTSFMLVVRTRKILQSVSDDKLLESFEGWSYRVEIASKKMIEKMSQCGIRPVPVLTEEEFAAGKPSHN